MALLLSMCGLFWGAHRVSLDFVAQFGCPLSRNAKKLKKAGTGGPEGGSQFPNLATKEIMHLLNQYIGVCSVILL